MGKRNQKLNISIGLNVKLLSATCQKVNSFSKEIKEIVNIGSSVKKSAKKKRKLGFLSKSTIPRKIWYHLKYSKILKKVN
jgi:hypothetical protein